MRENINAVTERFDVSLFVLMHNLGPHLINRVQLGLTPGQVFMLHFIQEKGECSVSQLAEKMEVAPSAVTVMVDRLENHGFAKRIRDEADRRVVKVGLTDAGTVKLGHVVRVRKQVVGHCLSQLDANEVDMFIHSLESLASIARAMDIEEILGLSNQEG